MLIPTGLVGLIVARRRGVPLVVYSHGGDVRGWRRMRAASRWLARLVAKHADRLLTNSEDTAAYLRELGGRPEVVPPGADLSAIHALSAASRSGASSTSAAETRARATRSPRGSRTRSSARGSATSTPPRSPALIAAHDVVLVPSIAEPFGLVAVEAIASGRWVVASAVGGLPEIVRDGVNGTLVSDGDFVGALARVPDYDPFAIAPTVERYSLAAWQAAMTRVWDEVAPVDG